MRRRLVALGGIGAVLLIIIVAIASAGGDDDEQTPITTVGGATGPAQATLPKADVIDQADAICAESNSALASVEAEAGGDQTALAAEQTDIVGGQLSQLQTLPAPEEGAGAFDRYLRALQDQVDALNGREQALDRGDDAAVAELEGTLETAEADAQAAAEDFGLEACGDPTATATTGAGEEPTTEEAAPVTPVPEAVAPAPVEPAPTTPPAPAGTEGGGATLDGDTGADTGGGGGGDTGGVSPGSGGVSP